MPEPSEVNRPQGLSWDSIARISQIAVLPLLGAMFFMLSQMNTLDRRMAVLEAGFNSMPQAYTQVVVLREKAEQNARHMAQLETQLRDLENEVHRHETYSTYDPESPRYEGQRRDKTR